MFSTPCPACNLFVNSLLPFRALLRIPIKKRRKERIIAIDSVNGDINKTVGNALTNKFKLSYVKESLK